MIDISELQLSKLAPWKSNIRIVISMLLMSVFFSCAENSDSQVATIDKDFSKEIMILNRLPSPERKEITKKARDELKKDWIPNFQRKWYVEWKSEKAFYNITPQWYGDLKYNLERYYRFKNNKWRNKQDLLRYWKGEDLWEWVFAENDIYYNIPKRDDAFLLYLWLPQVNNTFWISDYQPSNSKEMKKVYFKPNYRSKKMKQTLVDVFFKEKSDAEMIGRYSDLPYEWSFNLKKNTLLENERIPMFNLVVDSLVAQWLKFSNPKIAERVLDNPLWDFSVSYWVDEEGAYLSIYDIWDLNPFQKWEWSSNNSENSDELIDEVRKKWFVVSERTEVSSFFWAWMPFEIYDRIYIDPKTKKIIE